MSASESHGPRPGYKPLWLLACFALSLFVADRAEARRGFFLITYGDKISEIGPLATELKADFVAEMRGGDPVVAFYYQSFGLFWVDLWTWGGTFCIYDRLDMSYLEVPEELAAAAAGKSTAEIGKPLLYRFPPGLVALVGLGSLWLLASIVEDWSTLKEGLFARKGKKKKRKRPRPEEGFAVSQPTGFIADPPDTRSTFTPAFPTDSYSLATSAVAAPKPARRKEALPRREPPANVDEVADLLRDPLYREAIKRSIQQSSQQHGTSADGLPQKVSIKSGVEYLAQHGIEIPEAKTKLAKAVPALLRAQRQKRGTR